MSDHEELADDQEELVERMQRENDRVGENADAARDKFEQATSEETVPHALGDEDPARRADEKLKEGDEPVTADPENIDDEAREGEEESGDDIAAAAGPSGDETDDDAETPDDSDDDRGDNTTVTSDDDDEDSEGDTDDD